MVTLLYASDKSSSTVESLRKRPMDNALYPMQHFSPRWLRCITGLATLGALLFIMKVICQLGSPFTAITSYSASQTPESLSEAQLDDVDWSKFAYVQYVTNRDYLCNSVMLFETLSRIGSRADRVMMYPSSMAVSDTLDQASEEIRLLSKAQDEYNVRLQPVELQHRDHSNPTWADSLTKLLVFNQTQYSRVLYLDSDSTVLQAMDELFLLVPATVAMPRAYWLWPENPVLSSQLMLVQPSTREFERVMAEAFNEQAPWGGYDMDVLNRLYKDDAMVLPHRPYNLLTGEFRAMRHNQYLGLEEEPWDPVAVLNEAKFVHFSDWPAPKPWIEMPEEMRLQLQPKCVVEDKAKQCVERDIWNSLYEDFTRRRELVCKSQRPGSLTKS